MNLNEVDIAKVHVGQPVRITLDAYPQKIFTGKVTLRRARRPSSSRRSRSSRSRSRSTSSADAFRTGMSANVEILGEKRDKAVSIPLEALQSATARPSPIA